jgi:hypothetical protein
MSESLKRHREEDLPEVIPEGLQNGGHLYPKCSNCAALLMDIFVTRPHEPEVWKVRAECPFCGDCSFTIEVKGGFHMGGYGTPREEDSDDDIPSTVVEDFTVQGDTFVFIVKKAGPDARAVRG